MLFITFSLLILFSHCAIKTQYSRSLCVCDITDSCDYLCCCDTECKTETTAAWKKVNSCNPQNDNGLTINFCSDTKSPQISDLHSGLRMIYQIIKRLFCLQSVNFKASNSVYNTIITKESASNLINNYVSSYNTPVGYSNPYSQIQNTSDLPLVLGNGICQWGKGLTGVDIQRRSCQGIIKDYLNETRTITIQNYIKYLGNKVTLFYQNGTQYPNSNQNTVCTNSTNDWNCNNIVCEANIQIVLNDPNNNNVELTICNISNYKYSTIQQVLGITYIAQAGNTNYKRAGNIGYTFESNLIAVDKNNYSSLSPFRIKFANSLGQCVTDNPANFNVWDIKFGQDFAMFCKHNNQSKSLNNTIDAFSYLGAIGNPNLNYALDYVKVANSITNIESTISILSIQYYKIGQVGKSQFQIKSARIQTPTNLQKTDLFSFFIEFKQIPTPIELFVPPPPTAQVKLDDDVLYPFL